MPLDQRAPLTSRADFAAWLAPLLRPRGMDDTSAHRAFDHREHVDRFGDSIQFALALFACFFLPWPVSIMEIACTGVLVCWFIRLWFIRRCVGLLYLTTPFVLVFTFWIWEGTSLAWSGDRHEGVLQWGGTRFAGSMLVFFPLMRRRTWFVYALAAGFLIANGAQLLNWLGTRLDTPALIIHPLGPGGRNGGWSPEVVMGELLVAALGLHIPAALLSGAAWSRARVFAAVATVVTIIGIAATGTRGGWIAAALLLCVAAIVAITRIPSRRARFTFSIAAPLALVVAALLTFAALRSTFYVRWNDARNEILRMTQRGEYDTNTGLRIRMAAWAWNAFCDHPLTGVGVGGFRSYVLNRKNAATDNERKTIELFEREGHEHCHNAPLQLLATTGVPGFLLMTSGAVTALCAGFRLLQPGERGTYAEGPPWALLGMLLISPFDVIYISAQPAALLFMLMALCPGWRPRR